MEDVPPHPESSRTEKARPQALAPVEKVASLSGAKQLLSFEDWLLVGRQSSDLREVELLRSDGTAAGTQQLHQASYSEGASFSMVPLGERVLFTSGAGLWSTDVTPEGTARVKALPSSSFTLKSTGTRVFLRNLTGMLWQSDGTEAGTQAVADAPSGVSELRVSQGLAWFSASDPFWGQEAYTSDGTPGGTRLLLDINPGPRDSIPWEFTPLGKATYFRATERFTGGELWVSDGTSGGTRLVADLAPGSWDSFPVGLYPWKDHVYFWVLGIGMGNAIYRSDGTEAGTQRVSAAVNASTDIGPDFEGWGDFVFFAGSDSSGTTGTELWRTDGTADGTVLVADLNPGTGSSLPASLTLVSPEGPLFFVATTPDAGHELWRLDSPTGKPTRVDVFPGTSSSNPANLTAQGPTLYFTATDATGEGLFKLSGLVADTRPPRVTCPTNVQVAATGPDGAVVTFPAASARDDSGEAPTLTAEPESGSVFPVGVTEVQITAVDGAGNRASCTFDVTVEPWVDVDAGTEDGGTPPSDGGVEMDAGVPPMDAGTEPDAGDMDAGPGPTDAGAEDGGSEPEDGGTAPDAGTADGGTEVDAGPEPTDAGEEDAGSESDAGAPPADGGTQPDAGAVDGGAETDAGSQPTDAGTTDAGTQDGGTSEEPPPDSGCGCQSTSASVPWSLMLLGLLFRSRRQRNHGSTAP